MHAIKQKTQQPIASVAKRKRDISFSVIMPTYNQCAFIRRAIQSLLSQSYKQWELIIVNDGSTDETENYISDYINDSRISYIKNDANTGLGHAINQGLDLAKYDYIAYLPSDDFYYKEHLSTICRKFEESVDTCLVYTGLGYDISDTLGAKTDIETMRVKSQSCLQLVQTAHRKSSKRWLERTEYITEDLFQMYWSKLLDEGNFVMTNEITCFWTPYRFQRHCMVSERYGGGLNILRSYYGVKKPIRMRVSKNKYIDENEIHRQFSHVIPVKPSHLKILLVGELAYHPERIYALEQAGHKLYGLWVENPDYSFSEVGPLPFGHIEDIPNCGWEERIRQINPDVIYGLLNAGAVQRVYQVVKAFPDIPYVWHFKEGPFQCLRRQTWNSMMYLFRHASGIIYINDTIQKWYEQFLPPSSVPIMIMDGDLPKSEYFTHNFSKKLSDVDGEIHTLVAGRMIGVTPEGFQTLVDNKIHIHLYNENYYELNTLGNNRYMKISKDYFHVHKHVAPNKWVEEFSKYDAGWLHCVASTNNGQLIQATWDDLNVPARLSTYAAAGLPVIILENRGHLVAVKKMTTSLGVAITYENYPELAEKLRREVIVRNHSQRMMDIRLQFSFDNNVPKLIQLFKDAIKYKHESEQ